MTEREILCEGAKAWVYLDKKRGQFVVYRVGLTHSTSDCAFPLDFDGFTLAKARADYLNR